MSTERSIERLVADALQQGAPAHAPGSLVADVLTEARRVRRRPRWLALVTERPMARPPAVLVGSPAARVASVLLVLVLAGLMGSLALVAGGVLRRPDLAVVVPPATVVPNSSTHPAPTATTPPPTRRAGLVAYTVPRQLTPADGPCPTHLGATCTIDQAWLAETDGSDARRLFPDDPGWSGVPLGWSADGSSLLLESGSGGLTVTDASLAHPQAIDPAVTCRFAQKGEPPDRNACTEADGFALSPEGTRIAFVRGYANARNATVLAILDLADLTVTELPATRATNGSDRCWNSAACQGTDDTPRWSPDGTQLVFARQNASPEPGTPWTSGAVYLIGADGSGMQRLSPPGIVAFDPSWSPDGETIAFTGVRMIVNASRTSVTGMLDDVYTVGSDGAGLRRLTDDGDAAVPRWTATGRVNFVRAGWNWVMDPGGGNARRLDFDLGALTAAGCLTCRYPGPGQGDGLGQGDRPAWWQPVPGR